MLVKFAVKNFRGFADWIGIDFRKHANYAFSTSAIQNNVIKNAIFYGPNGCGKSNFSMAIFDIVTHLTENSGKEHFRENYVHAAHFQNPVEFEYEFLFGQQQIVYKYQKLFNGILVEESLEVDDKMIFSIGNTKEIVLDEEFSITEETRKKFKTNVNNVSVISNLISSFPLPENHYLIKLVHFVESMLWYQCLDKRSFIGLDKTVSSIDDYIINNGLVDKFQEFLTEISKQKFDLTPSTPSATRSLLMCRIGSVSLPFTMVNSTGTKALTLLFFWLMKMQNASFVFIDEFDAFYHFQLAFDVCEKLFALPNCQICLTSHNTYLMTNDLLRPDCNFIFCQEGQHQTIKPLYKCTEKELRFGHNIGKLYRAGAFVDGRR